MILLVMMLQGATPVDAAAIINVYQQKTSARIPCRHTSDGDEIVVCARRDADRYRVPLVADAALPYDAPANRVVALKEPTQCDRRSPFLVGCGAAGVTVSTSFGPGKGSGTHVRSFAP